MKSSLQSQHIAEISRKGKKVISGPLVITYIQKSTKHTKKSFSIILSKKNIKRAVDRNKIRRVLRKAAQQTELPFSEFLILYRKENILTFKEACQYLEGVRTKV